MPVSCILVFALGRITQEVYLFVIDSLADTIAQIQSTRDELEDVLVLVSQFTDWWSQTK